MPPPSPPSVAGTPKTTRHRKTPSASTTASPRDRDAPLTVAKRPLDGPTVPVGTPSIPPRQPGVAPFLGVAIASSLAEIVLQSVASQFVTKDLAAVSRQSESWIEVAGLLLWRFTTLGIYWFGGYDAYDVASLTLLLKTPTLLLLKFFYLLPTITLASTTISTIISTTLPFALFRSLSPTHTPRSHPHAPRSLLRNRSILTDPTLTVSLTILSATIFTVILEVAFQTFLPVHLVTTFSSIRSVEFSHLGPQGIPILLLVLLPAGYACTEFLFVPSAGATALTTTNYSFDRATAGFAAHVYHNAWGWYSVRQRALLARSFVLAVLVLTEISIECAVGLKDVEVVGALGYAAVWGAGVAMTAVILDWVSGPSD